jgi:hypothetical protein
MEPTDVTIEILKSIRDEVSSVRGEVSAVRRQVGACIDATNQRLDQTNERLEGLGRRVVESEMRTVTAISDLHGTVRDLVDVLRAQHDLRPRVDRCERDIVHIKDRLGM